MRFLNKRLHKRWDNIAWAETQTDLFFGLIETKVIVFGFAGNWVALVIPVGGDRG